MTFKVGILTVSDRVSRGEAEDKSGPALAKLVNEASWMTVAAIETVADDVLAIQSTVKMWTDAVDERLDLILTTGGTGFGVRDITPEVSIMPWHAHIHRLEVVYH
jgi:gephyrin